MAPLLKVRTVTAGVTLRRGDSIETWQAAIAGATSFCAAASKQFTECGFEVQTTRISTNSFEEYIDASDVPAALDAFRAIDAELVRVGAQAAPPDARPT